MRIPLLVFLMWFGHSVCLAKDKVQLSAVPDWIFPLKPDVNRRPVDKNISNGYYLELIDQQVNLITNTRYVHYIRNIVNETGVQNAAEVSVTFAPQYQEVVFHTVSLIRNHKVINKLTVSQIRVVDEETEASEFLYSGQKRAFVILKDVQKGDRVEFAYSIIGFNPAFKNRYDDKIYFSSSTAVCNYFEVIIAPENRKLHVRSYNGAPEPVQEIKGNARIYHWSNPPTKIWESQPGVPVWFDNHPYVSITEYNNWQEVIDWGIDLFNNYKHPLPSQLQNEINEWRKTAKGDKDLFAILAIRYVQDQIRYLGMETGVNTHKPHSPAEVFQHRYGDCKDKSLLLAMILQTEKIPAYVAFLSTTKKQTMAETAPSPGEFDHAIVAVQRSSGYVYIDPTVTQQRGELVNLYLPDYKYAMVIREGEDKLQSIEPDTFSTTQIEENLEVKNDDSSRLEVSTVYQGGKADATRSSLSGMSVAELEESYLQYYSRTFDGIQLSRPIGIEDDSVENEITVKEQYAVPQLWSTNAEGKEAFEVYAKAIYEMIPDPADIVKNAPMALSYPSTTYYTLTMLMPEPWEFPKTELHIKNESYQFDFSPSVSGRVITLKYVFRTLNDHVREKDLAQYKTDYKKMVSKLSFELYRTSPAITSPNPFGGSLNWVMIWFSFGLLVALSFLFRYLNNLSIHTAYDDRPALSIGSWLVFLGVSLAVAPIFQLVDIFTNNFFDGAIWKNLGETGNMAVQSVFMIELALKLIWISGSIACFYWFICRRDIFPRMFIGYVASILLGQVILLVLYSYIPFPSSENLANMMGAQLFRSFIYALIWVSYILRSERVRGTFVKTM